MSTDLPSFLQQTGPAATKGRYCIVCREWNDRHVKFALFDGAGANCGFVTVLSSDVFRFIQTAWHGDIFWENKVPTDAIDNPEKYGAAPR